MRLRPMRVTWQRWWWTASTSWESPSGTATPMSLLVPILPPIIGVAVPDGFSQPVDAVYHQRGEIPGIGGTCIGQCRYYFAGLGMYVGGIPPQHLLLPSSLSQVRMPLAQGIVRYQAPQGHGGILLRA